MSSYFEKNKKLATALVDEYCDYVALRRCLNDDEVINNHIRSVAKKLSLEQAKFFTDIVFKNLTEIENKIENCNDPQKSQSLFDSFRHSMEPGLEKFPITKIIEAIQLIKPQKVFSADCNELEYEAIKSTLPIEFARKFVIESRASRASRGNDSQNSR